MDGRPYEMKADGLVPLGDGAHRARRRRAGLIAGASLLVSGGAAASYAVIWGPSAEETAPQPETVGPQPPARDATEALAASVARETETPETVSIPAQATRKRIRFGRAGTFRSAMARLGIKAQDYESLEDALSKQLDFRRCQPSHGLEAIRDEQGKLRRFVYHLDPHERIEATRVSDGWEVKKHGREEAFAWRLVRGRVEASLGAALEAEGLNPGLAGVFVEVFGRKMRFDQDTREGDRFSMLLRERYLDGEATGTGTPYALHYRSRQVGLMRAYAHTEQDGVKVRGYYDPTGQAWQGQRFRTPVPYAHISSHFDLKRRHPILKRIVPHLGTDFAAGRGTPVYATADGKVTFRGRKGANGNLVVVAHGGGIKSYYAHLSRFARRARNGASVSQGQVIGYVGSTGRSTGPHLHFAIRRNGRFINPLKLLHQPGPPLRGAELEAFRATMRTYRNRMAAPHAVRPTGRA